MTTEEAGTIHPDPTLLKGSLRSSRSSTKEADEVYYTKITLQQQPGTGSLHWASYHKWYTQTTWRYTQNGNV